MARAHVHPQVELGAAYDFIEVSGVSLDRLPHHRWEGWIQGQYGFATLHIRGRYYGKFVDQGENLPGYFTLEATASAVLSKQYLLVLRGDDLLDSRPETHSGYFGPGIVVSLVLQGQWQ